MFNLNQLLNKKKKILIFLKSIIVIGILLLINGSWIKGDSDGEPNNFGNRDQNNLETLLPPEQLSLLTKIDNEIKDKINNILKFNDFAKFQENINNFTRYIEEKNISSIKLFTDVENNSVKIEYSQEDEQKSILIRIEIDRGFLEDDSVEYRGCSNQISLETTEIESNKKTTKTTIKNRNFNDAGFVSWKQDSNNPWDSWDLIEEEQILYSSEQEHKISFKKNFKNDGSIDYSRSSEIETTKNKIDDLNSEIIEFQKYLKLDGSIDWDNQRTKKTIKQKRIIATGTDNNNYKEIQKIRFFLNKDLISWKKSYNISDIRENNEIKKYCVFFDAEGKISWNEAADRRKNFVVPNELILDLNLLSSDVAERESKIKHNYFKKNEYLFFTLGLSENDVSVLYDSLRDKYIVKFELKESLQEYKLELKTKSTPTKLNEIFFLYEDEKLLVREKNVFSIKEDLYKAKQDYCEKNNLPNIVDFDVELIENNGNKTNQIILINSNDSNDLLKYQISIKLEPLHTIIKSDDEFDIKTRNIESLKRSVIKKYPQLEPLKNNLKIEILADKNKAFLSYDDNINRSDEYFIKLDKNKPIIIKFKLIPNKESFLSSYIGFEEVKKEFKYINDYLKNPKKYDEMKIKIPRGYILYGPPGTGKTHLARTLASDLDIPFDSYVGSEFEDKWKGDGAKKVREIFGLAREKRSPCIIFIDEIDALLSKRVQTINGDGTLSHNQTVNQFLSEIDGFKEDLYPIFVIGATNRLDSLDSAVTRSGRLDKHIFIGLPKKEDAQALLKHGLKDKKLDPELYDSDGNIKDDFLAEIADKGINLRFSNADFMNLINKSAYSVLDLNDESLKKINKNIILQNLDKIQKEKKIIKPYVSNEARIIGKISLYFILLGLITILIGFFFVIYIKYQKKKNKKRLNF